MTPIGAIRGCAIALDAFLPSGVLVRVQIAKDADKDTVLAAAKADPNVQKHITGKQIVREIVVPGRLVNLVVK